MELHLLDTPRWPQRQKVEWWLPGAGGGGNRHQAVRKMKEL